MKIAEIITEAANAAQQAAIAIAKKKKKSMAEDSGKRCMQCGMINCKCPGDSCKCKPIKGWVPGKGFKKAMEEAALNEKWSQKYKSSINCSHPKGFSQKAHCAGKKKHNESHEVMEMTCPDCGMCKTHGGLNEISKGAKDSNGFTKCWPGKHAEGTKKGKNGKPVRNCVPNESQGVAEDWNKINHHDKTNGLSQKAVNAYRHEHPGSKLKTAVTTKPSKLKAGSKDAKRRKSFCARMSGNKGPMKKPNGKPTPKALALRRWHCESLFELFVTAKKGIYEAEGEPSGLKHLTPHLAQDILDQMKKEGVHAIVKSIEWGDGGAKELIAMIKRDLEQIANNVTENFADGKNPGRKGLAKRSGVNTKASVSSLRKTAKHSTGEKARMAHWLANMKAGRERAAKEDAAGVGTITAQNTTGDVNKNTPKKNLRAFRL